MHNGQCDACAKVGMVVDSITSNGTKVQLCSDCVYMQLDKAPRGYAPTVTVTLDGGFWHLTYIDIYHVKVSGSTPGEGHAYHVAQLDQPLRQIAEAWIKGLREPRIDY